MREFDIRHRIALELPGMDRITRETIELPDRPGHPSVAGLYRPITDGEPVPLVPAVVFVHGDARPETLRGITDWGQYVSWGQAAAANGMIGITFEHASSEHFSQARKVIDEVDWMLEFLRSNGPRLGIDPDRIAIWTCSGGAPFGVVSALRSPRAVRCLVVYYGFLDLRSLRDEVDPRVTEADREAASPAAVIDRVAAVPPTLIVKAGLDRPAINESIETYLAAAARRQAPAELLVHPSGRHGFDVLDDDETTRTIISRTLEFLSTNLGLTADLAGQVEPT